MSEYGQKLRDPRWQRKRLEIMQRDEFKCRLCGDHEATLNVHHLLYQRGADPWDYRDTALLTVCEACHEELHISRFGESLLESLVVGGANLSHLYGLLYAFEMEFLEGPSAGPLPAARWDDVVGAVAFALSAVRRGSTEADIRDALEKLG